MLYRYKSADININPRFFAGDTLLLKFHGIGKPHPMVPETERPYWLETNTFLHWIAASDSAAREFAITIIPTFDDGNKSDLDIAAAALAKYDMLGAFFPCTGRASLKHYLNNSDIRALAQMGHEIGIHGVGHVPWTSLDPETLDREIHESKWHLEDILSAKIDSAAIPFGAYNRCVLSALRSAAFSKIYTSDQGIATGAPATINRCLIRHDDDPQLLGKMIERFRTRQHRLILNFKTIVKSRW